jgi:hypothetical protein
MLWWHYLQFWKWPGYAMTRLREYEELQEAKAKRSKAEEELAVFRESAAKESKEAERAQLVKRCVSILLKFSEDCKRVNGNDRYYQKDRLAKQLGEHGALIDEVLEHMRKEGLARYSQSGTALWEIVPFVDMNRWP